jgi:hypothetical protein
MLSEIYHLPDFSFFNQQQLLFQIFESNFMLCRGVDISASADYCKSNSRAMTKGLITKKNAKKEPTKSLKEKRKEKKEKKSAK